MPPACRPGQRRTRWRSCADGRPTLSRNSWATQPGASPAITGQRGPAYDLDLRRLAVQGATLLGRVRAIDGHRVTLAPDLAESLADGDRAYDGFVDWVEARRKHPREPSE